VFFGIISLIWPAHDDNARTAFGSAITVTSVIVGAICGITALATGGEITASPALDHSIHLVTIEEQ